jgi:hypothetical protein
MDVDKKKPWCRGRGAMSPPPPGKKKTEDEERGAMSLSIFYCLAFNMNGEKEILVWQLCVFCFNYIFLKKNIYLKKYGIGIFIIIF